MASESSGGNVGPVSVDRDMVGLNGAAFVSLPLTH